LKKYVLSFLLIFCNYIFVFAQSYTYLAGKIVDADTKVPLAGVYVGIPAKGAIPYALGVMTNESGEFVLKYPVLLQASGGLNITKINYKDLKKSLIDFKDKKDSLQFEIQSVEEKTIEARDARKTIDFMVARLEKNYNINPYGLTGFYRETLQLDSTIVKLSEAVLKVEKYPFPDKGNLGEVCKLLRGRRYEKPEKKELWESLQFGNGADLTSRTLESKLPDFLEKNNLKNYKYQIEPNLSEYDGMPVFNITFSPVDKKLKGAKIGKMQVDTLTMGIIGYEYEFTPDGLRDVMGGGTFGGQRDSKVVSFKVSQLYHAALNNYYLSESLIEIDAVMKEDKTEIPAKLKLVFYPTEASTRITVPIKDNEILENTDFPVGGKKYEDSFWGNFNFVKAGLGFRF
jgi:hypothetical protein